MGKAGKSGITTNTPKNIMFGAGTIHKNLKFTDGKWNFVHLEGRQEPQASSPILTPTARSLQCWDRRVMPHLAIRGTT